MAKDRNTFAKRQREVEKKRKADQKRERRKEKKRNPDQPNGEERPQPALSAAEQKVLGLFRQFLMSPGRMLCLGSSDLETHNIPLASLTDKGMLVAEKFKGGYSLTEKGFAAMQQRT